MLILPGHDDRVRGLAYAPDGRTLASCSSDWTVRTWDLAAGARHREFRGHRRKVLGVVFRLDGRAVVSSGNEVTIRSWDLDTGESRVIVDSLNRYTYSLLDALIGWPPKGTTPEARIRAAEAAGWRLSRVRPRRLSPEAAIARRTELLATALQGTPESLLPDEHRGDVITIEAGPGSLSVFVPKTVGGTRSGTFVPGCGFGAAHEGDPVVAFSPDDRVMALTAGWSVVLWDFAEERSRTLLGHQGDVWALAFAPDGRTLATGGHDGTVRTWDVADGRERSCVDWEVGIIDAVAFAPDGMTLAAGGKRGIVVWDVDEGGW